MRLFLFTLATTLIPVAALAGVQEQGGDAPPPPPLNYPYRPVPLALGEGYEGNFGTPCYDDVDAQGSFYHDIKRPLVAGRTFWFNLSSPDFEPTLTIFKAGEQDRPIAQLVAAANGRRSGFLFRVTEAGDYVFRTSAPAGEKGRWFTEIIYDGKREHALPERRWSGAGPAKCGAAH